MTASLIQPVLKIKKVTRLTLVCLSLLVIPHTLIRAALPAAPIVVSAKPDTNQIRIGEQFKITLKANVPTGVNVNFPLFPDTLNGIEIVSKSKIDTITAEDKSNTTYIQSLLTTSFDSGYYAVEPFHFTSLNKETGLTDTFSTEAFLITVKTIDVDTTVAIKDIKPILTVPVTWQEILTYSLIGILSIALIWFLIHLWKKRKKTDSPPQVKIPSRPPYELALEALKKTEQEKLWQQGLYKQYHSNVSDILRQYIEHSYDINALELTTDETLDRIHRKKFSVDIIDKLASVLQTADLVKFAKLIPMADENEKAMSYAYDFVNSTRPVTQSDFNNKEVSS